MSDIDLNAHENRTNKHNSNEAESGKWAKRICLIKWIGDELEREIAGQDKVGVQGCPLVGQNFCYFVLVEIHCRTVGLPYQIIDFF